MSTNVIRHLMNFLKDKGDYFTKAYYYLKKDNLFFLCATNS